MTLEILLPTLGLVFVAASAQRISGMGFALVLSPFMVLIFGPHSGILLVNLIAAISSSIMFSRVWRDVDWRMYAWLTVPAVIACVPASILAVALPAAPLSIGVGALLLVALITSLALHLGAVTMDGNGLRITAGVTSGISNALAGVAGPTVSVYAVLSRWDQRSFAATVQPYFATVGLVSMATKSIVDPGQWPALNLWMWAAIVLAIVGGMSLGERVGKYVHDRVARRAVVVIAFLGAGATLVKGLLELNG